jgi:hypothetical protein
MTPHIFALQVLRETTARALANVRKRRPLAPELVRLREELARIDRDLSRAESLCAEALS